MAEVPVDERIDDSEYAVTPTEPSEIPPVRLKLIDSVDTQLLDYNALKGNGVKGFIRSPRRLSGEILSYINAVWFGLNLKQDYGELEKPDEFFEGNERKYSDASSKWYKELYNYDIMPEQIKQNIVSLSKSSNNKVFANSGLLAIENEIVNFAEKYSAYDKCKQSDKYLERIIDITQNELQGARDYRNQRKKELEELLEEDKKSLIASMEKRSNELADTYSSSYNDSMKEAYEKEHFIYTRESMKSVEKQLLQQNQAEHNYSERIDDVKDSLSSFISDFSDFGKKNVSDIFKNLSDDLKETWDNAIDLKDTKVLSDKETADDLLRAITKSYNTRIEKAITNIDDASRQYWDNNAISAKDELIQIVANSTTIDDDKKEELSEIILSYGKVKFKDKHEFTKAAFEKKLWLLMRVIYLNKINTHKLAQTYNKDYAKAIADRSAQIKESHNNSFVEWLNVLVDTLRINIVEYSPKLSAQAKQIAEETKIIEELEETKNTLTHYKTDVVSLMDWEELA